MRVSLIHARLRRGDQRLIHVLAAQLLETSASHGLRLALRVEVDEG